MITHDRTGGIAALAAAFIKTKPRRRHAAGLILSCPLPHQNGAGRDVHDALRIQLKTAL